MPSKPHGAHGERERERERGERERGREGEGEVELKKFRVTKRGLIGSQRGKKKIRTEREKWPKTGAFARHIHVYLSIGSNPPRVPPPPGPEAK